MLLHIVVHETGSLIDETKALQLPLFAERRMYLALALSCLYSIRWLGSLVLLQRLRALLRFLKAILTSGDHQGTGWFLEIGRVLGMAF